MPAPDVDSLEKIAAELNALRVRSGLSIRALADRAHYSRGTIHDAERGHSTPTTEVTRAYVEATGADAETVEAWVSRISCFRRRPPESVVVDELRDEPPPVEPHRRFVAVTPRIVLLVAVASTVLVVTWLLGVTPVLERHMLAENTISMSYPVDRSLADSPMYATGRVSLTAGRSLWLLLKPPDEATMYTTTDAEVAVNSEGVFRSRIDAGRGKCDEGKTFRIVALSVPRGGSLDQAIDARKPGQYSARITAIPSDAKVLTDLVVTVKRYRGNHTKC